jgi:hypothetical protein
MYTELVPFIEERGLVPAPGELGNCVTADEQDAQQGDAARVRYRSKEIGVCQRRIKKGPYERAFLS